MTYRQSINVVNEQILIEKQNKELVKLNENKSKANNKKQKIKKKENKKEENNEEDEENNDESEDNEPEEENNDDADEENDDEPETDENLQDTPEEPSTKVDTQIQPVEQKQNVMDQTAFHQYIISSFHPQTYGIAPHVWQSMPKDTQKSIFENHVRVMQAQYFKMQNNNIQDDRIKNIHKMNDQLKISQQTNYATQQATQLQQQQFRYMQQNGYNGIQS